VKKLENDNYFTNENEILSFTNNKLEKEFFDKIDNISGYAYNKYNYI
jgi:hypothetical protein